MQKYPPGPGRTSYFDFNTLPDELARVEKTRYSLSNPESGDQDAKCGITSTYHASPWEKFWMQNIHAIQSDDFLWTRGCEEMLSQESRRSVQTWLEYWKDRGNQEVASRVAWDENVFSFHEYIDTCTRKSIGKLPIEPLVGSLRHPLAVCDAKIQKDFFGFRRRVSAAKVNKDYMLETRLADFILKSPECTKAKKCRRFLFDLGASTYSDGKGGPSMSWFIETYKKAGFEFDRVLSWDARKFEPREVFKGMPFELLKSMSYFNLPVESEPESEYNPWRYIRELTMPEDFVVVKLDIDAPATEAELVRQILFDDDQDGKVFLSDLIDEFYFEHHVWGSGMSPDWTIDRLDGDIAGSYRLFSELRKRGIRAHSWV